MESAQIDDALLVRSAIEGDQGAFQSLVERHQDRLFSLVRHYTRSASDVEDIVQDTFLKAYRKLESFQHQANFGTWLCRIATNTALDVLKRRGRNPVQSVEDPEVIGSGERGPTVLAPDARLESDEIAAITRRVLEHLPEIFRRVLVLREFEEMSYQDMADLLEVSIGTVESRLFRARARFRDTLARLYPEFSPQ